MNYYRPVPGKMHLQGVKDLKKPEGNFDGRWATCRCWDMIYNIDVAFVAPNNVILYASHVLDKSTLDGESNPLMRSPEKPEYKLYVRNIGLIHVRRHCASSPGL
jgi:hypothetical protein